MKHLILAVLLFVSFSSWAQDLEKNNKAIDLIETDLQSYPRRLQDYNLITIYEIKHKGKSIFKEDTLKYKYQNRALFNSVRTAATINEYHKSEEEECIEKSKNVKTGKEEAAIEKHPIDFNFVQDNFRENLESISEYKSDNNTLKYYSESNEKEFVEVTLNSSAIDLQKNVQIVCVKLKNPVSIQITVENTLGKKALYSLRTNVLYCLIYKNEYDNFKKVFGLLKTKIDERYNEVKTP